MKILIHLGADNKARIADLVNRGVYTGVQEFMTTAIENLLISEEGGSSYGALDYDIKKLRVKDRRIPLQDASPPADENLNILGLKRRLVWGKHRIFPTKFLCRLLCTEPIEVKRFRSQASEEARRFGLYIMNIDEAEKTPVRKRFSAGFPISTKQADRGKAKDRFGRQYVFAKKWSGKKSGALLEMLFANTKGKVIGLTDAGVEFARLSNPIIDEGKQDRLLSREETEFLLRHFKKNIPAEYEAMEKTAQWIDEGKTSKVELNRAFGDWIRGWQEEWHDLTSYADTQRAGTINRMAEMCLIEKKYRGFRLDCSLTALGREFFIEG